MIKNGYALTPKDLIKLDKLKKTPAYKSYVTSIISSPIIMKSITNYINNVTIENELTNLDNFSIKNVSELFNTYLNKVIINITADAIILHEIASVKIDNVSKELTEDFKIKYLMGLAESEHYKKAEEIIAKNNDTNSIVYLGYIEFLKRTNAYDDDFVLPQDIPEKKHINNVVTNKPHNIDLTTNDIQL